MILTDLDLFSEDSVGSLKTELKALNFHCVQQIFRFEEIACKHKTYTLEFDVCN